MNNKGFTLIELLVVVLIIGILAAIALPQYTKAVERSRTAEAVQWLGDVATAQQIYYMQNNSFAENLNNLNNGDVRIPALGTQWSNPTFTVATGNANVAVATTRNGGMYSGGSLTITIDQTGAITKTCGVNSAPST